MLKCREGDMLFMCQTCVIACSMVRDELERAFEQTGCQYPVKWLDAGLHNYPDRLRREVQAALDQVEGYRRVLLAYGFCGNSVAGIRAGGFEVVLPRADDCITTLLGSRKRRLELSREGGAYFLTRAWLHGERNILVEYRDTLARYGEEQGKEIFEMMFGNYRQFLLLDDGCYPIEAAQEEAQQAAKLLGLTCSTVPASNRRLRELLTGPWPEAWFLRLAPGETLTLERLLREEIP